MSRPIIEVSSLSKRYHLGVIGATRLRDDIEYFWQRLKGEKEPPEKSDFWALKDVSFTVQPGEVVGIIGRNGAGKSTLLKILSRITEPTKGEVVLRGRVASLLEVGTGFHPDLTGRENVYLNGAIMGMTRAEVRSKMDEIVAFAEVEKFLDTPVKHYSSGMYVRLAFAVAAHLDPEILIVDEVLAVGDQAFQQRCLGKLNDVAHNAGRTVIFVSHNMAAVNRLCDTAVYLSAGQVQARGAAEQIVSGYLSESSSLKGTWTRGEGHTRPSPVQFLKISLLGGESHETAVIPYSAPLVFGMECREFETKSPWVLRVSVFDCQGNELLSSWDTDSDQVRSPNPGQQTRYVCSFPGGLLKPGSYYLTVSACELAGDTPSILFEELERVLFFEVSPQGYARRAHGGLMGPKTEWSFARLA